MLPLKFGRLRASFVITATVATTAWLQSFIHQSLTVDSVNEGHNCLFTSSLSSSNLVWFGFLVLHAEFEYLDLVPQLNRTIRTSNSIHFNIPIGHAQLCLP